MFSNTMILFFKTLSFGLLASMLFAPLGASAAPKPVSLGSFSTIGPPIPIKTVRARCATLFPNQPILTPRGLIAIRCFFWLPIAPAIRCAMKLIRLLAILLRKDRPVRLPLIMPAVLSFSLQVMVLGPDPKMLMPKVVRAMKAGSSMVVVGRSGRGTRTTDKYSLAGVSAAMKKIDETCR